MKTWMAVLLGLGMTVIAVAASPEPLPYRIVVTGGELLNGVYPDSHTHFLARTLRPLGAHCLGSMIVDDVREQMLDTLRFATNGVRLVIVTGGLGPTPNDITRETLSEFTGIPLREDPDLVSGMAQRSRQPREHLRPNLRRQAEVPTRGAYLKSINGTAAGLVFEMESLVIVALPGPPRELQPMVIKELLPYLRRKFGVRPLGATLTLRFVGVGQSQISQTIKDRVTIPPEVVVTSLFEGGRVDFFFSLPNNDTASEATLSKLKEQIRGLLSDYLYAEDDSSLEEVVIRKLQAAGGALALAEVATGGQLATQLNRVTGATNVVAGAYAAPTEETLARLLKTRSEVSELAVAAARQTQSAWALAVGRSQVALKFPDGQVLTKPLVLRGPDEEARALLVTQLLDFLRRSLRGKAEIP